MTEPSGGIPSLDGLDIAWKPLPKQQWAMECPAFELLYGGSKGGAKPLDVDTPVPTPTGWSTQGELRAGDSVIGADGKVARVLGTTGPLLGRDCYRVGFSDGTSLVADADHPWSTLTNRDRIAAVRATAEWRAARRARRPRRGTGARPDLAMANATPVPRPTVRTTREILETLYVGRGRARTCNHSIEAPGPAELPRATLPVPPYTLGAWLGDGSSADQQLTSADEGVIAQIRAEGFEVRKYSAPYSWGILRLRAKLKEAGVLGRKRVPIAYLRASIEQRLELLRGLMDTDGTAALDGSCSITLTNRELFEGVVELLRSLGIVVRTAESVATCTNSKTRTKTRAFRAVFVSSLPVFHLRRKLERQNLAPHPRWTRRFITSIEPVESRPVCCIATDRPDGLYLAGTQWITTHNTNYLVASVLPILTLANEKYQATGRKQHKCRIVVFRKNLDDLKDFLAKTFDVYPIFDSNATYNRNEKTWTFDSGATVELRHLDGPTDHLGFNGNEFVAALFDEVQFISYEAYSFLVAQVRSSDPDYRRMLMVRATANPGGPHGDWVKRHFKITEYPDGGRVFAEKITLADGRIVDVTRAFIRSWLRDNPHVDPDGRYEAQLRATMSPDEVRMYLDGDFNVVAGAFFSHLLRPQLHFVKSRSIPGDWEMRFSIDWGSSAPASLLVGALDPDNRLWVIDELHEPGVTGRRFGEKMARLWERQAWSRHRKWRVDDFYGVIDKQAMDGYGSEGSAADGIAEHGFRVFPAQKDRSTGCNQMKERLCLDRFEKPQMVVFEDRCPNLVAALKSISSNAPEKPDEYDPKSPYSHSCDSARFLCMEFPTHRNDVRDKNDEHMRSWERLMAQARARQRGNDVHAGAGYVD